MDELNLQEIKVKGPDLANLILRDKVNIGFSLRALGAVEPMHDGTLMVKSPILPITYDIVTNPSHANARVMEFIPESDCSLLDNISGTALYESDMLNLLESDQITICENGMCFRKFTDEYITEIFGTVASKISFRLQK